MWPVNPDANVYGIALALALLSGLLFGLVPVRQVLRTDPYQIVKSGSTGTAGRRITVRDLLLVVQIAICAVLVTSSMVAVRGLVRSMHGNFGFEPRERDAGEYRSGYGGLSRGPGSRNAKADDRCRAEDSWRGVRGIDRLAAIRWGLGRLAGFCRRNDGSETIQRRGCALRVQHISRILPCGGHSAAVRKDFHVARR